MQQKFGRKENFSYICDNYNFTHIESAGNKAKGSDPLLPVMVGQKNDFV